jgi:hypothetical protein
VGTLAGVGSLTRRAVSPKYGPDRDQPTTYDRGATATAREADDRDPAERDRPNMASRMVAERPISTRTAHGPDSPT